MFAAGALVGGALVLATYLGYIAPSIPKSTVYSQQDMPAPDTVAEQQPQALAAATPGAAAPTAAVGSCPAEPIALARGAHDGLFQLSTALAVQPQPDAAAFLAVAREAVQQGSDRDAEVAYIAACHVAQQATGAQSAPVADIKSHMGQHYVALAGVVPEDERQALLQRAGVLFAQSAEAYAATLGKNASKTRLAAQRLASLEDPEALQAAMRTARREVDDARVMGAAGIAAEPLQRGTGAPQQLVRSDAELSQLERDIERLHAQASNVSRDRAGMRQRDAQAAARAASCPDKACLLRFYAQRRSQLLEEF